MDSSNEMHQPWKSISADYLEKQARIARETNLIANTQEPAGRVVYKGGSGGAPGSAVGWKAPIYDTRDDEATNGSKSSETSDAQDNGATVADRSNGSKSAEIETQGESRSKSQQTT